MQKQMILTSEQLAEHPFAGQNKQQTQWLSCLQNAIAYLLVVVGVVQMFSASQHGHLIL